MRWWEPTNCHFAASVVLTVLGGGDTQTQLDGKKIELYALTGSGDAKTF